MPLQPVIQVLARCFSKLCLKAFGEIRMIVKSYHIHHFGNGEFLLLQQHGCFFHADGLDIFHGRHSGELLDFPVNLLVTDSRQFAKCVDIQVCIGEVIFNQTGNVRQIFLILRFCFDLFKYGERFLMFFGFYVLYFVFLYSNYLNAQPDGSSLSFFGGDSIDRTAV